MDTYTEGIYATLAFINKARWSEATRQLRTDIPYGIGRRFVTSSANRITPDNSVTPDCAVQLTPALGVIAETKAGVTKLKRAWADTVEQLQSYDDELVGWWTAEETVPDHDIVVLIPVSSAVDFNDYVEERKARGTVTFTRRLSIVAFFKQTGADQVYITLKTESGRVSDEGLAERLRRAQPIRWSLLLGTGRDCKFMDAEPQLPYTLWILWDIVLAARAAGREPERGQKWVSVEVEIGELTQSIQSFYGFPSDGSRSAGVPRKKWVKKALDALVIFGLCEAQSTGHYRIRYERKRGRNKDTLEHFGRLCHKHERRLERYTADKPLLQLAE